jgi:Dyp-type peroxidase family
VLEVNDIQGLLLSGYGSQPSARYIFYTITDRAAAKRWLADLTARITNGAQRGRERTQSINVALTRGGLEALGLGPATLASFSRPFIEGMAQPDRARLLGDEPDEWQWGKTGHQIHVVVMLFAVDAATLERAQGNEQLKALDADVKQVFALASQDLPGSLEHFGFLDGLSQPDLEGYRPDKYSRSGPGNIIKPGEFILGYLNEYGKRTSSPLIAPPDSDPHWLLDGGDFGRNGSYLVIRQIEQDVAGFWNNMRSLCPAAVADEVALAAKIVGRWPDGTPLAASPDHDGGDAASRNDFGFRDLDRQGDRCPIGAHIRRANPRDALLDDRDLSVTTVKRHRLLRRGRPYGRQIADRHTDDQQERGLVFVALNANIERQFEFVQQAWISAPSFAGLYDEADPLLGGRTQTAGVFSMPEADLRRRRQGVLPHVKVQGGEYFFLPSIRALNYLSA